MKFAGGKSIWSYRKEALSLVYLFLIGVAIGAMWLFYDRASDRRAARENVLAFEEDHKILDVVIAHTEGERQPSAVISERAGEGDLAGGHIAPGINPANDPWLANAVEIAGYVDHQPQVSIVIDDLGVVRGKTRGIIDLSAPLTLSFLPYAPDLPGITRDAARKGHELMIHLPMEPKGDKDPGPHALLTTASEQKLVEDLFFNLSRFTGYVGFNNHMGSAFTENRAALDVILDEVEKRGLLILDSRTSSGSLLAKMATGRNIPNVTRDFFLDNEQDVDYILAQLAKLEKMARRNGQAIAIGHPYAETIAALEIWLPTLKNKGIAVVPLSHIVKRKYHKIHLAEQGAPSTPAH